jgi:hypothetical protein
MGPPLATNWPAYPYPFRGNVGGVSAGMLCWTERWSHIRTRIRTGSGALRRRGRRAMDDSPVMPLEQLLELLTGVLNAAVAVVDQVRSGAFFADGVPQGIADQLGPQMLGLERSAYLCAGSAWVCRPMAASLLVTGIRTLFLVAHCPRPAHPALHSAHRYAERSSALAPPLQGFSHGNSARKQVSLKCANLGVT